MKAKTARRWLRRNRWKIAVDQHDRRADLLTFKDPFKKRIKGCLKALKKDIRENKNPVSLRFFNDFMAFRNRGLYSSVQRVTD